MEGRKTKHAIVKTIVHYVFFAIMIAAAIVAYVYRADTQAFFLKDLTNVELINNILHFVPKLIVSVQIIVLASAVNFILKLLVKLGFGFTESSAFYVGPSSSRLSCGSYPFGESIRRRSSPARE